MRQIKLPKGTYKLTEDNKVLKDLKAIEAKLDISTRLKRKNSKKVSVKRK